MYYIVIHMKQIVFDSSTAILMAKIGLLEALAGKLKIIFPEAVREETAVKKDSFDSKLIMKLIGEKKIKVAKASRLKADKLMKDFNMERGEAEALALAKEKKCMLATDDWPSIKACRLLGVKFATAIHFLIRSHEKGELGKERAMEKLKALEKYGRYGYDIIKDAKNKIEGG